MPLPSRILITGAAGNLGSKLRHHLAPQCQLTLIDQQATAGEILAADLAVWEDRWVRAFAGIEVVIHLAGNPNASHGWSDLIGPNLDAVLNVFEAAARAGVRRVIFASSNHVMGGYQHEPGLCLTTDLPPRPGARYHSGGAERDSSAYAATKLAGERIGKHFAEVRGLEVIAVRLGWTWRGDNTPAGLPTDRAAWFRQMWLSDRDFLHLMECCLVAPLDERFVIVHGMSANTGMVWDLAETARRIGYTPLDDVHADV